MGERQKSLLAIVEMGGYPNFVPLYEKLGYKTTVVNSQRKARNFLKQQQPNVVVSEYNFQSDFRDRTSNIETLMAVLQKHPQIKLVVFYMPEHKDKLDRVAARFEIDTLLPFPVNEKELAAGLVD
jgi:DNA-binding NtrC family response regulator